MMLKVSLGWTIRNTQSWKKNFVRLKVKPMPLSKLRKNATGCRTKVRGNIKVAWGHLSLFRCQAVGCLPRVDSFLMKDIKSFTLETFATHASRTCGIVTGIGRWCGTLHRTNLTRKSHVARTV